MIGIAFVVAGVGGFLGVIADTIGAHILPTMLQQEPDAEHLVEVWKTAARYQLLHALLLCVFAALYRRSTILSAWGISFVYIGMLAFCMSLYGRVLTGYIAIGNIAPVGGIAFMLAWMCLALVGFVSLKKPTPSI